MQLRRTVDEAQVLDVAAKTGVDIERMKSDMNDPAIQAAIDRNLELAQALRINGTPGFVIGEQILRGAADLKTLQGLIHEARNVRN
jgi:protein-disulfide isomerase